MENNVHIKTWIWIFIAPLFIITNLGVTEMSSNRWMNKQTNTSKQWNIQLDSQMIYEKKETWKNHQYILLHKGKSILKRIHTVWFQLYDMLEKA